MEWFKYIDIFNDKEENVCNADGSVLINLDTWKKKEKLDDHLNAVYKDYQIEKRTGLKKYMNRFSEEVDDLLI